MADFLQVLEHFLRDFLGNRNQVPKSFSESGSVLLLLFWFTSLVPPSCFNSFYWYLGLFSFPALPRRWTLTSAWREYPSSCSFGKNIINYFKACGLRAFLWEGMRPTWYRSGILLSFIKSLHQKEQMLCLISMMQQVVKHAVKDWCFQENQLLP